MATVKIRRRLVPKNPFHGFEEGSFDLPDGEEVLNVMDLNSYNFVVLSWEPPVCMCHGCAAEIEFEQDF